MEEIIPVIAISMPFIMVIAIVVIPAYFKSKERREMQATVRAAIDKGQPLPPEVIDVLGKEGAKSVPSAARDPDAASYAMRQHILLSRDRFRRLFDEGVGVSTPDERP